MTIVTLTAVALLAAMIGCEVALGPTKLQTGLMRTVAVFGAIGGCVVLYLLFARQAAVVPFAIFWSGAFLTWFGVRSHIESSILLRMAYLLRAHPMRPDELLEEYDKVYGANQRVEELYRAGLVVRQASGAIEVTPKGDKVLAAAARFR
jgi:hypothetical protein